MANRPLGIANLVEHARTGVYRVGGNDHWVWCRAHEQTRKSTERCACKHGLTVAHRAEDMPKSWCPRGTFASEDDCVTVGPFMSKREAMRLGFAATGTHDLRRPLGMEVEE